ncbi:MAG: hypothetical protein ACE5DZ_04370 [Mariprofundus sp.]
MYRGLWLTVAMLAFAPLLHGQDLMDWLHDTALPAHTSTDSLDETDMAELLTLEPGENEMYPRVSPDGKYLLVISGKRRKPVITRRLIENGDPVNIVSENDPYVLGSINWRGNDTVTFLSYRADSLGLWEKPVAGGIIRRSMRLDGELANPVILDDGSIIAVRLRASSKRLTSSRHQAPGPKFDNWAMRGKQPYLVYINKNGAEHELTAGVNPSLSPDGQRLVFSMQAGKSWHLFMMSVDGSDLIQLTEGRNIDVQPTWSPDGKWIAFTSNRGDSYSGAATSTDSHSISGKTNWDIWLIGHDGRGLTRLTRNPAKEGAPSISGNGRVYFHSDRKVDREDSKKHQVKGSTSGFHIWSVALPARVS